ncbi:MAG: hypothetical protein AAGA55_03515 [Planctomycetota bacterium]
MGRYAPRRAPRFLAAVRTAGLGVTLTLASCHSLNPTNWTGLGGSGGSGVLVSDAMGHRLDLDLPNRAAAVRDQNTADVYLTDLSDQTLDLIARGEAGSEISGTIVEIHIFLNPKPGKTPIESTAASATIRTVILSRGQVGVYDGAGFLAPGRSLEKGSADGRVEGAQVRLSRSTGGFQDLLGPARIDLNFDAPGDDEAANRIARVVRALSAAADRAD